MLTRRARRMPGPPLLALAASGDLPDRLDLVPAHGVDLVVEVEGGIAVRWEEFDAVPQAGGAVGIHDGEAAVLVARPRELEPGPFDRLRRERPVRRERLEPAVDDGQLRARAAHPRGQHGDSGLELIVDLAALGADAAIVDVHHAVGPGL